MRVACVDGNNTRERLLRIDGLYNQCPRSQELRLVTETGHKCYGDCMSPLVVRVKETGFE